MRRALILLSIVLPAFAGYGLDVVSISNRVAELQPTPAEKRFDEIVWVHGIREAKSLAQKHGRPVFLFTHDGRINTGRC